MSVTINPSYMVIPIVENSSLFEEVSDGKLKEHESMFRLKTDLLSKDKCHIFYSSSNLRNLLVATALEFFTFHPLSKLSGKFEVVQLIYNGAPFFRASFPKEFAEVCHRAAQTYQMHIVHAPMRMQIDQTKETRSKAPALTLADDYKNRMFFEKVEKTKPIPKDALAIPVKKHLETNYFFFPRADNILWVQGKTVTRDELHQHQEDIVSVATRLHLLGVD